MQVLFLSCQKRDGFLGARRYAEKAGPPFPILLDTDRAVAKAYGIYAAATISLAFNVAKPAAVLIDRGGIVRHIFVGGRNRRPGTDALLDAARRLG